MTSRIGQVTLDVVGAGEPLSSPVVQDAAPMTSSSAGQPPAQPRRLRSLGASPLVTFRRIIFPNLLPALLSGAALAFSRAVGEFEALMTAIGTSRAT